MWRMQKHERHVLAFLLELLTLQNVNRKFVTIDIKLAHDILTIIVPLILKRAGGYFCRQHEIHILFPFATKFSYFLAVFYRFVDAF